jgi:DNA ligase D-like protein (predicted 3'-phosphoesterase)
MPRKPKIEGGTGQPTPLDRYRRQRDFGKTPEPAGEAASAGRKYAIFVVQKHQASHLHYDFRLEVDGVLKSWAVPKGVSNDPANKRLAVAVADHPLEYADFEGVIPEGEYGGGTVMVWDRGIFRNLREAPEKSRQTSMAASVAEGKVEVWLEGQKLKGGYVLINTKRGGDRNWLLFKMKDRLADSGPDPAEGLATSALTGRTMEEIAAEGSRRSPGVKD